MFEPESEAEADATGGLTINGTLVPASYSVVLYPENGEADESAPHAA